MALMGLQPLLSPHPSCCLAAAAPHLSMESTDWFLPGPPSPPGPESLLLRAS